MKIKKIRKVGSTQNPVSGANRAKLFQGGEHNKKLDRHSVFNQADFDRNIKNSIFTNEKITLKFAIEKSATIDKIRDYKHLKLFYLKAKQDKSFVFIVKSSGLYEATKHQVNIQFQPNLRFKKTEDKIRNSKIKFQCSCGAFTYRLRYVATKNGVVLGLKETRYPKVKNKFLRGLLCKHLIRVMKNIPTNYQFKKTFERYIKNDKIRITQKDKLGTLNATNT